MKTKIHEEIEITTRTYILVDEFLEKLNLEIEKTKSYELTSELTLKFSVINGYDCAEFDGLFLRYVRLETDEEYKIRKEKEEQQKKEDEKLAIKSKKQREINERKLYLKLKAKFENE